MSRASKYSARWGDAHCRPAGSIMNISMSWKFWLWVGYMVLYRGDTRYIVLLPPQFILLVVPIFSHCVHLNRSGRRLIGYYGRYIYRAPWYVLDHFVLELSIESYIALQFMGQGICDRHGWNYFWSWYNDTDKGTIWNWKLILCIHVEVPDENIIDA